MEQSIMRVDACRPIPTKTETLLLLELLLQKLLLRELSLHERLPLEHLLQKTDAI